MSLLYIRRGVKSLLPVLVTVFLFACSTLPGAAVQPVKSANDENAYRVFTLENELQVLLISDPETKKAAAALDVMVGSGDNPEGREGLAHFLEHMLFLGTDKYPDAAEYEEFVTEHGGRRNAYTSMEHTNYFFDINEASLPEALDRFAQFFIAPRFDAQYVDREKNAVEAEYQMGLKSDGRRGLDVLQESMNPAHPFAQFSVGSLETLSDRPGSTIRDDLLAFYDKYYSANQMRLVVLGSQSLDELEALVRPMFSPIPNRAFKHEPISEPIFSPGSLPMLVQVEPQATLRQLEIIFPIADYRSEYKAKPLSYLGNLVGHEGEGSLLSQLKAEGLADGLGAGSGLAWRGGALFSVNISLTESGVENYERVLQLLFAYTDMLRAEGPREWLYDEQARLSELGFRFREDSEPMGYVSGSAAGMHYYAPEDILQGPSMMTEYDKKMLDQLMAQLVPENARVTLNDKSAVTDRKSNYYQVPYSRAVLNTEQLTHWQSEVGADKLSLPVPNEFIADNVSLKEIAKDNPAVPAVVFEGERQKIWFVQDDKFRIPKGATYINFRSPAVGQSAEQTAAAVLYTALLIDSVNEYAYPALLAGLNFNLYKHAQGISLRISGYDDKQKVLLDHILEAVQASDFDEQRFTDIRKGMIRALQNSVAAPPRSQVIADLREAMLYGEWSEQALIDTLESMDQAALLDYAQQFWRDAQAEIMVYGNYDPNAVEDISAMVSRLLPDSPAADVPNLQVLKLAEGEALQYAVDVPHDDSVVAWYLQGAGNTWADRAATAMTAQVMKSGFFQQLRTEQQLGYAVSASSYPQLDVPGIIMLVQSPSHSAVDVAQAMETFLGQVESSLDEEQFGRHKQALLSDILRPEKNLWERAEFYWQSIAKKQFQFDARQEMAAAVEGITLDSWKAYFTAVFMEQRRSLQVVSPGRWDVLPPAVSAPLYDATDIKKGHETYLIQ
ncbi:MAG: insulinase family protein [Halioglobus sp.]